MERQTPFGESRILRGAEVRLPSRGRRRWSTIAVITTIVMVLGGLSAMAADLAATIEVDGSTATVVEVEQGSSTDFVIHLTAAGAINAGITSSNPSKAKVHTSYSLSATGQLSSGTFSGEKDFFASDQNHGAHKATTWTSAPTPYSIDASVSAHADTPADDYSLVLSVPAGTVSITNPSSLTPNLGMGADKAVTIILRVVETSAPQDTTPPTITINTPAHGAVYTLHQIVNADYSCVDNESAVTQCSGPVANGSPIDTSSVGRKSFTVDATSAGGSTSLTHTYRVEYHFVGFTSPVSNPNTMNIAKAGQAIPLKWRLLDANDNPVRNLASVSVTVMKLDCSLGTSDDDVEEYAAGASGLQNLGDGYYQFNWKTPNTYASSCKTMRLNLGEGSQQDPAFHTAIFQFRK